MGRRVGEALTRRRIAIVFSLVSNMYASSIAFSGEATTISLLLSNLRPWCIGRFVFDRPATSEISSQRYEFRGEKLETQYNVSLASYKATVETWEKALRERPRLDPGRERMETGHPWLERAFSPVADSRVFVFQKLESNGDPISFDSESYIYGKTALFHTTGEIGSSAIGQSEQIYSDLVRRIKERDNWAVPTEAGFCFDGGIVTGPSTYPEEVSQSFALMPGRPALLVIQMRTSFTADQGDTLTRTLPELRAQLSRIPGHYRIIREGKRTIAGMNAEEVLFEIREGQITAYQFYLLAPGEVRTHAKPHTAIQLLLGASRPDLTPDQATSPVDEAGALQVWEAILNSLRLRPGAV
jgi:hypothetical protein